MANQKEKKFNYGEESLTIILPTVRQVNNSDIIYSRVYTESIKNGILPRALLEKEYKENGAWNEERENRLSELSRLAQADIIKIQGFEGKEEKESSYTDFLNHKLEYEKLFLEKNSLFQHSAETKAESAKTANLIWQCVIKEDKTLYWPTEDSFLDERDGDLVSITLQNFFQFTRGITDQVLNIEKVIRDFIDKEPEEKVPAKVKNKKETKEAEPVLNS